MRQGQFSQPHAPLAESTVSDTINHVAAVFRENGYDDPKWDAERNVAQLLRRQLRSYKKDDPKKVQQKALPVCVLFFILSSKSTELCQAMGKLAGGTHFWAMCSCKYAKVPKAEQRQIKQLWIGNIAFNKDDKILKHNSPSLHLGDCVLITFERQKNDRNADTVTQWRTADKLLCPIKIWASLIRRILSYKGTNKNSPVSLAKHNNKIINVTGEMIADLCHDRVVTIRESKLGIHQSEIGTTSICSGAAMAMYLSRVPIFSIMLIRRWSSTAFLKYIWKQVQEFVQKISSKMIEVQTFKHIQNPTETNPMENIVGDLFLLQMG